MIKLSKPRDNLYCIGYVFDIFNDPPFYIPEIQDCMYVYMCSLEFMVK